MKKERSESKPPQWAERFLSWYCKPELLEDLQGDLNEYFDRNLKRRGRRQARWIYVIDVFKFFRVYTIRKPKSFQLMNFTLLQNNFKTSARSLSKNKLFTAINVTGLAISMCLGLLLITFISELKSFDRFQDKYDQIYRVRNTLSQTGIGTEEYASTSLLAAKQVKESVTGVKDATIIRRGFNKDVHFGDKIMPLKGFWADESFFTVFSFPVLAGDPTAALKKLNSIVLTESSAMKLIGTTDVVGNLVIIDSVSYEVGAIVKDIPLNSHLRFDILGSFATIDSKNISEADKNWMRWDEMFANYVYVLIPEKENVKAVEKSLALLSSEGNKLMDYKRIDLRLQPMHEFVLNNGMSMEIGQIMNPAILWVLGFFVIVVMISACFNYTNLSIARALRRAKEVSIRKVTGASRGQVFTQFMVESILLSVIALVVSYLLFVLIRSDFIEMDGSFQEMITLNPSARIYVYYIILAIAVGTFAGFLPALFFSKINTAQTLKDLSSLKLFKHLNLRKSLIIFQYTLSLLLIVSVALQYRQYKYSVGFDLGFDTENILQVDMQQNNADQLKKEFSELPEVKQISKANYIFRSFNAGNVKYKNSMDSTKLFFNYIDEGYIPLHEHKILAGNNFMPGNKTSESEVIINERTLWCMGLSNPEEAVGENLTIDGRALKVIGVVKDFHHDRVNYPIQNFAFRYDPDRFEVMSLKLESSEVLGTMDKLQTAWRKVDPIHPLKAEFYKESIHDNYEKIAWMMKIIGSIAFIAICIATLGLFGMVVFTTETKLKEISLRKVLGASEGNLVFMMSRGFVVLLLISALIAIPVAYYLFDQVLFSRIVYRAPIRMIDLLGGAITVMILVVIMIASQTIKVARANPAEVLKTE